MLTSSVLALACYGAVLGRSADSPAQAGLSALKLPLLFLMTLAICLPTLYLFNLVFGARLQVRQALALVMVTITVTAVLSLGIRADQPVLPAHRVQLLVLQDPQRGGPRDDRFRRAEVPHQRHARAERSHGHGPAAAAKREQQEAEERAVAALAVPSADAPVSPAPTGSERTRSGWSSAAVPAASVSAGPRRSRRCPTARRAGPDRRVGRAGLPAEAAAADAGRPLRVSGGSDRSAGAGLRPIAAAARCRRVSGRPA